MTDYRTDATGRPLNDQGRPVYKTEIRPERSGGGFAVIAVVALVIVGALYFVFADRPAEIDTTAPPAIENTAPATEAPSTTVTPDAVTPDAVTPEVTTPDTATPEPAPAPTPQPEAATPTPPATNP